MASEVFLEAGGTRFQVHLMPAFCVLLFAMTSAHAMTLTPSTAIPNTVNFFISGHSLTDQPMPDYLAKIAHSQGAPLVWQHQYLAGSSIADRSRGNEGMRALAELRSPKVIEGERYHVLLITERHDLLWSLAENNTVGYLRSFHEHLIQGNPKGTTWLYEPWLGINDKSNPQRWIDHERAASRIWQCIATRINTSLQEQRRTDRIFSVPTGAALAELIDLATRPSGIPGVTLKHVRATVDSLVNDDVHLTELGSYYAALVTYASIYRSAPTSAWHPKSIGLQQAESLQRVAWDFVSHYVGNIPLSVEQCRTTLRDSFINQHWSYVRDTYWMREVHPVTAYWRWLRQRIQWHWRVRRSSTNNPLNTI